MSFKRLVFGCYIRLEFLGWKFAIKPGFLLTMLDLAYENIGLMLYTV